MTYSYKTLNNQNIKKKKKHFYIFFKYILLDIYIYIFFFLNTSVTMKSNLTDMNLGLAIKFH